MQRRANQWSQLERELHRKLRHFACFVPLHADDGVVAAIAIDPGRVPKRTGGREAWSITRGTADAIPVGAGIAGKFSGGWLLGGRIAGRVS
jgi:hypothetical protein